METPEGLGQSQITDKGHEHRVPRTRVGSAWTAVAVGLFVLLLIALFVLQNGRPVRVQFLWLDGQMSLGLALLFAAVLGGLVVGLLGAVRIAQLRRSLRRLSGPSGASCGRCESLPGARDR